MRRGRQHAHWQQSGLSSYPSLRIEQSGKSPILSQSLRPAPSADTSVARGLMGLNHENRFRAAPETTHAGFSPARIPGAVLSHIRHGPSIFRRTPANIAAGGTGRNRTGSLPTPSPLGKGDRAAVDEGNHCPVSSSHSWYLPDDCRLSDASQVFPRRPSVFPDCPVFDTTSPKVYPGICRVEGGAGIEPTISPCARGVLPYKHLPPMPPPYWRRIVISEPSQRIRTNTYR